VCDSWFTNEDECIMGTAGDKDQMPKTTDGKTETKTHAQTEKEVKFDRDEHVEPKGQSGKF